MTEAWTPSFLQLWSIITKIWFFALLWVLTSFPPYMHLEQCWMRLFLCFSNTASRKSENRQIIHSSFWWWIVTRIIVGGPNDYCNEEGVSLHIFQRRMSREPIILLLCPPKHVKNQQLLLCPLGASECLEPQSTDFSVHLAVSSWSKAARY